MNSSYWILVQACIKTKNIYNKNIKESCRFFLVQPFYFFNLPHECKHIISLVYSQIHLIFLFKSRWLNVLHVIWDQSVAEMLHHCTLGSIAVTCFPSETHQHSATALLRPFQSGSEKEVSFESPTQLSDLCDIDDEGSYSDWRPTPSLL